MKRKLFAAIMLLTLTLVAYGQDSHKNTADSLLNALSRSKSDTARIGVLLELADSHIKKPGENKTDLDSAAVFIDRAYRLNSYTKYRNIYGRMLTVEARLNRERGVRAVAIKLAESAIQVLQQENDHFALAQAYIEDAANYDAFNNDQISPKVKLVEQGVRMLRLSGNSREHVLLKAANLQFLADLYTIYKKDTDALELLQESLEAYRSIHYPLIQGVYDLFGRIYLDRNDFKNAVRYELLALETAERAKDTGMQRCEINNTIGLIYLQMGEKEKAIPYFMNALKVAELNNDNKNVALLFGNIVQSYIKLKRPEDALKFASSVPKKYLQVSSDSHYYYYHVPMVYLQIYTQLKRFREAQYYCDEVIKMAKANKSIDRIQFNLQMTLVLFYIESENYPAALFYLKRNESLLKLLKVPQLSSTNYWYWYKLDTARHDYQAGNRHFLLYFRIQDSLFSEAKRREIQQLQVQFESSMNAAELKIKDQRILYLNAGAKLRQVELKRTNLIKNITGLGIVFLFVTAAMIYRQYRNKQKINGVITQTNITITGQHELITQKKRQLELLVGEKEWLLKEVHNRVRNNLHTIICLLESQAVYLEHDALKAVEKSQHRIYTMSLIHQKLYQSGGIETIDMAGYIPELVQYLKKGLEVPPDQIIFRLRIDHISLDPAVAIPVAMIINEALTNAIKYAFPGNRRGEIRVSLTDLGESVRLEVSDDGIGMHQDLAELAPVSLGLQLIQGLTKEIRGEMLISSEHGFMITILFRKNAFDYADLSEAAYL